MNTKITLNELLKNQKEVIASLTGQLWDTLFLEMKSMTVPSNNKILKSYECEVCSGIVSNEYHGETSWQRYKQYINDVLRTIRNKETDYCYYAYQVQELLRFEPNLKSRFVNDDGLQYWEVWL